MRHNAYNEHSMLHLRALWMSTTAMCIISKL
jgi:hypothetical protein